MNETKREVVLSRRELLAASGALVAAASVGGLSAGETAGAAAAPKANAETYVRRLYESLTESQKATVALPWEHPSRARVANNWHVVEPHIGAFYTPEQQELIRHILKNVTSEIGYEKLLRQMKDDSGGMGSYSCCIFGDPRADRFEWVMTGRHLTIRADGNSVPGAAFGGPVFYGHAVTDVERPDHPGNVWWHQSRLANRVFAALDGKQQAKALLKGSPPDEYASVRLQGEAGTFTGLPLRELSRDQKGLMEAVTRSLLEPYRKEDVDEALTCIKANGGWERCYLSFYQEDDLGDDKIWDRWKLEGPAFAWYFRGSPHVHTWVNVARKAPNKA